MLPANLLPLVLVALCWRVAIPLPQHPRVPLMSSPVLVFTLLSLPALYILFSHFLHPIAHAGWRLFQTIAEEEADAYINPPGPPLALSPLPIRRLLAYPTRTKSTPAKSTSTKSDAPSWPADQPRRSCLHYRPKKTTPPSPWKPGRGILRSTKSARPNRQSVARSVSFAPDATLHQYTYPSAGGILRPARSSHYDLERDLDEDPLDRPWPLPFRRKIGFNETVRVNTVSRWITQGEDHWVPYFLNNVLRELLHKPPTLKPVGNRDADGDVEME